MGRNDFLFLNLSVILTFASHTIHKVFRESDVHGAAPGHTSVGPVSVVRRLPHCIVFHVRLDCEDEFVIDFDTANTFYKRIEGLCLSCFYIFHGLISDNQNFSKT